MFDLNPEQRTNAYAKCIAASKRVRWEIEADVIRGRTFDLSEKFLPDGLTLMKNFDFLSTDEQRLISQIQGRTYANVFGLVERFINAKVLEIGRDHWLGDQTALEALVRFSDEELKHQELFRRIDNMMAQVMPVGYYFNADPNEVGAAVLSKSTWAVLTLTLHIELFTQAHYRESIDDDPTLSPLYKDVFLFHWREESQHAILDEIELKRETAKLSTAEHDAAVDDFIELVGAVDGILQGQIKEDARYFEAICGRTVKAAELAKIEDGLLKAYRWQYILSGAGHPQFQKALGHVITEKQSDRIGAALAPLM